MLPYAKEDIACKAGKYAQRHNLKDKASNHNVLTSLEKAVPIFGSSRQRATCSLQDDGDDVARDEDVGVELRAKA